MELGQLAPLTMKLSKKTNMFAGQDKRYHFGLLNDRKGCNGENSILLALNTLF